MFSPPPSHPESTLHLPSPTKCSVGGSFGSYPLPPPPPKLWLSPMDKEGDTERGGGGEGEGSTGAGLGLMDPRPCPVGSQPSGTRGGVDWGSVGTVAGAQSPPGSWGRGGGERCGGEVERGPCPKGAPRIFGFRVFYYYY